MSDERFAPPESELESYDRGASPALWNPDAAGVWSILFTPVFGSYLLLKNCQAIGDVDKIQAGRLWLGISVVMLIVSAMLPLVGLGYIILWYFLWQAKQTAIIRARWGANYQRRSWAAPLAIALGLSLCFGLINLLLRSP